MSIENTFNGAMNAYTSYVAYFNTVAQEIGIQRAAALITKLCDESGATRGKMMKEQSGIKDFDVQTALSLLKNFPESIGVSVEVLEESPQKVVFRSGRRPLYEAAQMMGLDAKNIETICRSGSERFIEIVAKQLNPNLSCRLTKFRASPDDFCESEIVLV